MCTYTICCYGFCLFGPDDSTTGRIYTLGNSNNKPKIKGKKNNISKEKVCQDLMILIIYKLHFVISFFLFSLPGIPLSVPSCYCSDSPYRYNKKNRTLRIKNVNIYSLPLPIERLGSRGGEKKTTLRVPPNSAGLVT